MHKLVLGVAAAAALALGSAANATITIDSSTNLNSPNPATDPTAVQTVGDLTTISFGQNAEPNGSFNGSFDFTNSDPGIYSILLGSSTPGVTFSAAQLIGINGTAGSYSLTGGGTNVMQLAQTLIVGGQYEFSFTGSNPLLSAVANGNVTIQAVPEPATWAMMLIGFGGIGLAMRRRRRPVLAQVA